MSKKYIEIEEENLSNVLNSGILGEKYRVFDAEKSENETEAAIRFRTIIEHLGSGVTAVIVNNNGGRFLFANSRYYELMGYTREQYHREVKDNYQLIHPEDRLKIRNAINRANSTGEQVNERYRAFRPDGKMVWIKVAISMCSFPGEDEPVQLAVFSDVTAEEEADEQLRFLNTSAHDILAQPDSGEAINLTLNKLLEYFSGDRTYVVELDRKNNVSNNTYEVCDKGISSEKQRLQNVPFDISANWFAEMERNRIIAVKHVDRMGEGEAELRELLRAQKIHSIILAPLSRDGELIGFVGVDNPKRSIGKIDHLLALGDYIAVLLTRRDLDKRIQGDFEAMQTLMRDTPGGFCRMLIKRGEKPRIAYVNEGFCRMLGMDRREVMENCGEDAFSYISIEGESLESVLSPKELLSGKEINAKCKLLQKSGEYRRVMLFGRLVASETGEAYFNAYFTDITEQMKAEAQLKLMTESIPGGLATFACAPDGIKLTYCNGGFCELFGISREEYEKASKNDPMAFVFDEDREKLRKQYYGLLRDNTPIDCIYRIHVSNGGYKWVHHRAVITDSHNGTEFVNAALFDITERQNINENLRVSEEENRLAIEQSGNIITKFDVRNRTLVLPPTVNPIFEVPRVLLNMPSEQIALGRVSPETADAYTELFESIVRGSKSGTGIFQQNSTKGWRWMKAQYTTVFSSTKQPVSAVITFADITEQLEKEVVYNKWQQSLSERPDDSYTLFRCNLSKDASYDSWEGGLLKVSFDEKKQSFKERTLEYAEQCIYSEDRDMYLTFMNSDTLLANYYRGHHTDSLEYREIDSNGVIRWLRLSVDLVEYPNSKDVEVYLMYENIDEQKREELLTRERSETDPLTGVYNRATFISRVESCLKNLKQSENHALFLFDIDDFKHINDTHGHAVGDWVLCELTRRIGSVLRRNDLLGRLGGDEFFVFMKDIPNEAAAENKAKQICSINIQIPNTEVRVTISLGVILIPRHGTDFNTLYKKVDTALYEEKKRGTNARSSRNLAATRANTRTRPCLFRFSPPTA